MSIFLRDAIFPASLFRFCGSAGFPSPKIGVGRKSEGGDAPPAHAGFVLLRGPFFISASARGDRGAIMGLFLFGPFGGNSGANFRGIAKFPENLTTTTNRIPVSLRVLSTRDEFPQPRTAGGSGSVRAVKPGRQEIGKSGCRI